MTSFLVDPHLSINRLIQSFYQLEEVHFLAEPSSVLDFYHEGEIKCNITKFDRFSPSFCFLF